MIIIMVVKYPKYYKLVMLDILKVCNTFHRHNLFLSFKLDSLFIHSPNRGLFFIKGYTSIDPYNPLKNRATRTQKNFVFLRFLFFVLVKCFLF